MRSVPAQRGGTGRALLGAACNAWRPRATAPQGRLRTLSQGPHSPPRWRACLQGAGALLAEAVAGVGDGLHSRAGALLGLVLGEDLLKAGDFKAKAGGASKLRAADVRGRVAAAAAVALRRLLDHVR